ncbi:hypothetical protein HN446_01060 [bacterium]|nr:hypothetical protein [bacterium]
MNKKGVFLFLLFLSILYGQFVSPAARAMDEDRAKYDIFYLFNMTAQEKALVCSADGDGDKVTRLCNAKYKDAALKYHPDKTGGERKWFDLLAPAKKTLKEHRLTYCNILREFGRFLRNPTQEGINAFSERVNSLKFAVPDSLQVENNIIAENMLAKAVKRSGFSPAPKPPARREEDVRGEEIAKAYVSADSFLAKARRTSDLASKSVSFAFAVNGLSSWQPETSGKIIIIFIDWLSEAIRFRDESYVKYVLDQYDLFDFSKADGSRFLDYPITKRLFEDKRKVVVRDFGIIDNETLNRQLQEEFEILKKNRDLSGLEELRSRIPETSTWDVTFALLESEVESEIRNLREAAFRITFEEAKRTRSVSKLRSLLSKIPRGNVFGPLRKEIEAEVLKKEPGAYKAPQSTSPYGDKVAEFNARLRALNTQYEVLKRKAQGLGVEVSG